MICEDDQTFACLASQMEADQARLENGVDVFYHIFAATMGK